MTDQQKILIVDDKTENLYALEQILRPTAAKIVPASSGNEALIASLNHEFALAILDVQMPGMDGYELAEYLRGEEKTHHLPLMFLSAVYSDDYHVFKGYEAGAVDFITKPYNPEVMLSKVKVFLQLDRQKRALLQQIELERAKNYLESILMAVSDAIVVVSLDAVIQTVNRAALDLLGYNHEEIIDTPVGNLFADDEFTSWVRTLNAAEAPETPVNQTFPKVETDLVTSTGARVPVLASGSALLDQAGAIQGAVLAAVDIADRKRAEQALQEYSENLEERVAARTRELQEAQEQLVRREKLALLGQLAGSVSHELRNPLGAIKNAAYFLNLVLEDPAAEIREVLEILDREVATAEKIIASLLDFVRVKLPLRRQVDLNAVVQEALARTPIPDAPRIEVVWQLDAALPPILADPDQLFQVLGNLILNSIQAMPGGGRLVVGTAMAGPEWVAVSVADSGVGIPSENLDQLFEPLFSTKAQGIGLGLPLAKALVEGHGGSIAVQSAGVPGQGSIFTVRLPLGMSAAGAGEEV
ncbi:MAG: response regulator [Chloroflexi bacterium]|nr:response regulator [Chloroflexota bacterium]